MPLEPDVLEALQAIGLSNPTPDDPLHVRLVAAARRTRGMGEGVQLVAMEFEFNWALRQAGSEFATAKTDYEHFIGKEKMRLMLAEGYSGVKAQAVVNGSDEAYTLLLMYRLAEQRERAMRKFLDTIKSALELHRTDRADQRASNSAHAQGYSGGA